MNKLQRTCLYCDRPGQFTDEHVFPAGLGGDDKRFLLEDLVCGHCNTEVFSKLETRFMRSSPAAIARIFLQPRGRGKGKKASIPVMDTRTTTVVIPDIGEIEAELLAGGKLVALLQLLFRSPGNVWLTGGDHAQVADFLDAVRRIVSDEVNLVEKRTELDVSVYEVKRLVWEAGKYGVLEHSIASTPPKECVWLEPLPSPIHDSGTTRLPTLYQRTEGQIVLRIPISGQATSFLTEARNALGEISQQNLPSHTPLERPSMQVSMLTKPRDDGRVLAKIGLNFMAHVFGEDYVRHHAFNKTRAAIVRDASLIDVSVLPVDNGSFSGVPHDQHVMALTCAKSRAGRFHVGMLIRLYGSVTYVVRLSANAPPLPCDGPVFLVVDYGAHRVEQLSALNFTIKYPPKMPASDFAVLPKDQAIFGVKSLRH